MGTLLVLALVAAAAGVAARVMWKDHKSGKHCSGCSGNCGGCQACHNRH